MSVEEIPKPWIEALVDVRPTTLDYDEVSTFEFVKRRAASEPNDPCMIFPKGKVLSYADTFDAIKKLSVKFAEMGIKKDDKIALMLPNTPHYIISHYAILSLGAVVVQTNPLYTHRELHHILTDSGATGMISLTMFQEQINEVNKESDVNLEWMIFGTISDYLKPIVAFLGKLLRKLHDPKMKNYKNNYSWKSVLSSADSSKFKETKIEMDDLALLQYTGGTTGLSKGAMLTHRNISFNAQQARALVPMIPDKQGSILTALPMFHSFGLTVCMGMSFQMGVPTVLVAKFDATDALKLIEKHGITFFPGVPTMMTALNNNPNIGSTDFSSLIAVFSGGAPLPIEVATTFQETTGADLVEGYGLSETSPIAYCNPILSEKLKPKVGSIGLPAADTFCKIVDTDDYTKLMPLGERGEICLKGPQVMVGYWNNEEESKIALKDGWLLTGDIGYIDEGGYAYIVDRKKDLIIVSGNNVVPAEVENVLYTHPAILEAAVAGLKHEVKGEIVAAWIVFKEGMSATEEEILAFCKENMAPFKIPKQITFRDELPKSMIGKILRRKLTDPDS
ncbi:MAG: long-chain fatty acid--CoA ligase [Candidatus Heimdallarchaeota archaeon]|nr:long-chain fatty acid--CoA ligase [Candidatus Heimdallarchaeota archaeon]